MRRATILMCCVLALPACKGKHGGGSGDSPSAGSAAVAGSAAELADGPEESSHEDHSGITWIHDDYSAALAKAKRESKPLVIDMWAAWCHTCLAMQQGVLRDRGLSDISGRFVWLALDTEKKSAAEAMSKFPVRVWPTFFVVSSSDESVQATQLGSTSLSSYRDFLLRGEKGHLAVLEAGGALDESSPLYFLRQGDQAWSQGDYPKAAAGYGKAVEVAAPDWPRRVETLNAQISALDRADDKSECAKLGQRGLEEVAGGHSAATTDFIYYANDCADLLPEAERPALRKRSLEILDALLADPDAALSTDDRSDALDNSRRIALALGDKERAHAYAIKMRDLLDAAVAAAKTPHEEMTYVLHEVRVHAFLGEGEKILPWVEELEKKLPNEYDPAYRKGWLLNEMGRYDDALEAAERALSLIDGQRKGIILRLVADIRHRQGKRDEERKALAAVVEHYESLPKGQVTAKKIDKARKALAALDAPPSPPSN
jgi:tetratricopeptide (TPR) repeat protein